MPSQVASTPDHLFTLRNNFYLGAYQAAINCADSLPPLSPEESIEKESLVFRSYIALGSYPLVINEIDKSAATALQAVKLLAVYLSSPDSKESVISSLKEWLADPAIGNNATLKLIAGTIFMHEQDYNEALKHTNSGGSMDLHALNIQIFIKMHMVDYAEKQLRIMQQVDEDHTLTQLANAWFDKAVFSRDVSLNSGDDNDCCRNWREKYAKLEEKRSVLRQAVKLLELQLDKVQAECASHKNACSLECARAELERKEKEKLAKVQTELEENICSLKLEVSLLGCADSNLEEKVKLLEAKITKGEAEIKHLKELLKEEKSRADLQRKNALSEKKRSAEAWKALEAEKFKADKERQISTEERKKFEQSQLEVEKLKKEVEGFRSRLVIETVKYEETSKKHELEKQKTMKEKKRADKEENRANEQRRLADESNRKLIEENAHVVKLCEEVEAGKQKITKLQEEKNKLLGYLNRSLLVEKDQADKFSNDVRIKKLPEFLNKLPLATGMTKTLGTSSVRQDNGVSEDFPSVLFGEAIGNLNCQKERALIITECDSEIMKESGKLDVAHKSRKRVLEESKVGNLSNYLAGKRQRIESFQHHEQAFQKPANTRATKSSRSKKVENMKLKLFKEQLKLEKMKTKHAKEVLEFEKCRSSILSKDIRQMRFDLGQYSRHLDMLDSFVSPDSGGVSKVGKNVRKYMDALKNNQRGSEPFHPCSLADTELFQPSGRVSSSDFVSGTDSQLQFSRGGSLRKKLESSAVTSFSDRGFLGSQDKACSPAANAKMVDDEKVETQCHGKVAWPAENIAHSSFQEGDPRVEMLEQKRVKSVELTDFRDAVWVNANKEHPYGLDNNLECREEFSDGFRSDLEGVVNLIGADFNYMRLLELDNFTDENRYNLASERLLSPLHDSVLEVIEANTVVANVSQRIGPPENDNHCVLSAVNVVESRAIDSKLGCAPSGTEIFVSSFGKQYGYALGAPPEFCVISSDVKDAESISNIFKATRSCMVQASAPSQTGRTAPKVSIISSLEDKLQTKEKICVFFTVLLLKLSHAWPGSAGRGLNRAMLNCVDSFYEMLITIMADDKTRSLFEEECQIDYLLHIIEDFLVDGRVALFPNTCSRPIVTSTRDLGIALNGNDGLFPSKTTSTNLVVGGGVVLATICAATNNIGFICEASYRIFQVYGSDTSLLLTILHAFSYICGKHYFASPIYGTLMVVVKSLVTYTEDSFMSESSGCCPMLLDGSDVGSFSCIGCPFREEAVSVDEITFLLLEKVAKTILSSAVQYDEAEPFCLLKSGRPHFEDIDQNNACAGSFPAVGVSDIDLDVWCPNSRYGMSAVPLEKKLDDYLNNNIELLSLLEIVANVVGWEFAQNKIIPSLLSIFKSCISIPVAAGIMVLIGRLGRIAVVAHGYDDVRFDTLRSELCDVVRQVGASDPSFTVQTAILNALLSLLPIEFVNIVVDGGGNLTSISQSQSLAVSSIRKWYSSLSRERQVLTHIVLLSTTPDK